MKSDDITIQHMFQDRRQFMVPFYQRSYVWTRGNQWSQLWDDIQTKAEARLAHAKPTPHFLGAVVLDPQPRDGLLGVDTLHIIDGQQRLTTLQFILKSVQICLKQIEYTAISEIVLGTLSNTNVETMRDSSIEVFKVWPTFRDQSDYRSVLNASDLDELRTIFPSSFTQKQTLRKVSVRHPPALEAVWYFSECFANWLKDGDENEILTRAEALTSAILQDLKVVSIVLDTDDDAQVIFETLNGRGAQLHATDLIRNFIFMRAEHDHADSEGLYNEYWAAFENNYWNAELRRGRMLKPRIEWFIHAALQAELGEEIDLGRLYFEYRRYVFGSAVAKKAEEQLRVLRNYSSHYQELVDREGSSPIAIFGKRIHAYDVTTTHPLALLIAKEALENQEKSEMYDVLISYIVRRAVCGLTTKNYNNVFTSLLRNISKIGISKKNLIGLLEALKGEASRWPRDEEFCNACRSSEIYPGRLDAPKTRSVLAELELSLRGTSKVEDSFSDNFNHLDIDHILPKSWYAHWPLPDGTNASKSELVGIELKQLLDKPLDGRESAIAARQESIPTLGNLTLLNLSVNREAQHKAFLVKKKLLLANTNLRLNVALLGKEAWRENDITERGSLLADLALTIWPGI